MKSTKLIIALILFLVIGVLCLAPMASAGTVNQPTQQFNKIFLNPFYSPSMSINTNYTFNITITPPDKISQVVSAIINFDVWMSPTVTFQLWVNNKTCNNPIYTISTTYASAGQSRITFDCSNIINKAGIYKIIIKPTQANTGAVSGWLDLTYMNNPNGDVLLHGTEYSPNEVGTIFLQLKDAQGLPIQDGSCLVDIWYPNSINSTHPYTLQDAPMLKAEGDDGIYYYDLTIPDLLGVYMVSAKCNYQNIGTFVYKLGGAEINFPARTVVQGTYTGNTIFLNDFEDWIYTQCSASSGGTKICEAYYDFDLKVHFPSNVSEYEIDGMDLYYMGEAGAKATISFSVWNWTSSDWVKLPNNLTFTGASATPLGVGDFISNSIPPSLYSDTGIIRVRTYTSLGVVYSQYDNWLNIQIRTEDGILNDIKGSSEMHVTDKTSSTASAVWNYTTRNLTFYPAQVDMTNYTLVAQDVWNYNETVSTNILSQFVNSIWGYTSSVSSNILSQISSSVWNNTERNLTFYPVSNLTINYTLIGETVWDNSNRNLTFYPSQSDLTNYSRIASDVWNNAVRNLTFYPAQQDLTNYNNIILGVWNATDRNLTFYPAQIDIINYSTIIDGVVGNVWNATDRNLTYYPTQIDMTNYTQVAESVWTRTDRNLTYYKEVTDYTNLIVGIWNATDRNLTFYPAQTDLTNYSAIEESFINTSFSVEEFSNAFWNYNGTIHPNILSQFAVAIWNYTSTISGSIISSIWSAPDRNLTYYPTQTDMINYTKINEGVWSFTDRNLTYYLITDPTNYTLINEGVWSAPDRNLTYYPPQVDMTNYTLISEGVWSFTDRNLTYYVMSNQTDLTNYTLISEGVWDYSGRYTHGEINS